MTTPSPDEPDSSDPAVPTPTQASSTLHAVPTPATDIAPDSGLHVAPTAGSDDRLAALRRAAVVATVTVGKASRATFGHRAGAAVAAIIAALGYTVWHIGVLRQASAHALHIGLPAFIAVQLVLVAATASVVARDTNPFAEIYAAAVTAVDTAKTATIQGLAKLDQIQAAYDTCRHAITVATSSIVHVLTAIPPTVAVGNAAIDEGILRTAEPTDELIFSGNPRPQLCPLSDPVGFATGGIEGLLALPSLDHTPLQRAYERTLATWAAPLPTRPDPDPTAAGVTFTDEVPDTFSAGGVSLNPGERTDVESNADPAPASPTPRIVWTLPTSRVPVDPPVGARSEQPEDDA